MDRDLIIPFDRFEMEHPEPDDRHLFEMLTQMEQGSTQNRAQHLYDDLMQYEEMDDDLFFNEALRFNSIIECSECHQRFNSYNELDHHIRERHGMNLRRCPECNLIVSKASFRIHIRNEHDMDLIFNCDKCERTFNSQTKLYEHRRTHQTECPVCLINLEHLKMSDRKKHINIHNRTTRIACPIEGCTKDFASQSSLNQHIRNIHSEDQRLRCPHCVGSNTTYRNPTQLDKHIKYKHR